MAFAALFPFVPLGALAAGALALASPPLVELTGIGRWDVHTLFSALGAAISLWVVLGPALAGLLAGLRLAGLRSALFGAPALGLLAFPGLTLIAALLATGGAGSWALVNELIGWGQILIVPVGLGTIWTVGCVALAQRLRLRVERRGLASGRDAP